MCTYVHLYPRHQSSSEAAFMFSGLGDSASAVSLSILLMNSYVAEAERGSYGEN